MNALRLNGINLSQESSEIVRSHSELPEISGGSQKQNEWAWSIREERLHEIMSRLGRVPADDTAVEFARKVQSCFSSQVSPKFWIDSRGESTKSLMTKLGW